MTWTYFTTYLDGTRPIAKAERDELYTNLAAKLATCSATLSLNSTDQTAITGSLLITDLASLDNSAGGGSNTRARLGVIIAATSGAWTNYSAAVTTALSGAGMTSGERDALVSSGADSYRLWNYYKLLIDELICPTGSACGASYGEGGALGSFTSGTHCLTNMGSPPCAHGVVAGETLYFKFSSLQVTHTFKIFVDGVEVYASSPMVAVSSVCGSISLPTDAEEFYIQVISSSGAASIWTASLRCSGAFSC